MSTNTTASDNEYVLLDSGNEMKLERLGEYTLVRPAPQAIWRPQLSQAEWQRADAIYTRSAEGGGTWEWKRKIKREFDILYNSMSFNIHLTDFGHIGLFPEQAANWDWLRRIIRKRMARTNQRNLHVLNLFAYTGGSTLACSQAGAHVTHLDAAKNVVDWARKNAKQCKLDERPIRWLVDDAMKYVEREVRRIGAALRARQRTHAIGALHALGEQVAAEESARFSAELGGALTPEVLEAVQQVAQRVARRVLFPVSRYLRAGAGPGRPVATR